MAQSESAQAFLASIDPDSLRVGNGSDGRPVWIGIDPEARKIYKVYASGLATGFGNGMLVSRIGVGVRAGLVIEQSTIGGNVMLDIGQGSSRRMEMIELAN